MLTDGTMLSPSNIQKHFAMRPDYLFRHSCHRGYATTAGNSGAFFPACMGLMSGNIHFFIGKSARIVHSAKESDIPGGPLNPVLL